MTDTFDVGPDPSDFIRRNRQRAMGEAITSLEDDPQKAGRAYELGRATGDSPALVYADLDNYEAQHKAQLTSQLLNSNEHLREYINADPMHAKLSNDDYANLDAISGKLATFRKMTHEGIGGLPGRTVTGVLGAAWEGFHEGIGRGPVGSWALDLPTDRLTKAIYATAGLPIEIPFRLLAGGIHAATEGAKAGAKEVYKTFTGDEQAAERFARDIAGMVEMQITGVGVHKPGIDPTAIKKAHDALISTKLWNESGREPPAGLDPTIDKLKLEQNNADIKRLDEMLHDAQSSATRERDPDTFARFVRMRDEGTIAIDSEAIGKLYGDKVPHGEDGLLGWEPSLEAQLATARATGGDIELPIADFLAKVDPEVYKALKDDIRVRPGGITKNEAKVASEQKEVLQTLFDQSNEKNNVISHPDQFRQIPWGENDPTQLPIGDPILRTKPIKYEVRHEDGWYNVYADGELENNFGHIQDAQNFVDLKKGITTGQRPGIMGDRTNDNLGPETKHLVGQKQVIPEDLPQLRAHAGLEPLFSIGDRKVKLERHINEAEKTDSGERAESEFHDFSMLDENGQKVGTINISEQQSGKQLYVDMIQGGPPGSKLYNPNFMGPALMRDLLRQIKEAFPNAETITGHRVSGAREKAGSYMKPSASPVIKLDNPDPALLRQLFADREFKPISPDLEAVYKPTELLSEREHDVSQAIADEVARLGIKADISTPSALRRTVDKREVYGAHVSYTDRKPFLFVALDAPYPIGTLRHEAIHEFRQQGFFTEGEWDILARAARDNDWIEKFNIEKKYKGLSSASKLEEAIADGFRDWKEGKPTPQVVVTLFERLQELFSGIKDRLKEIFGREVSWEELFQKVDRGEIGQRGGNAPRHEAAFRESVEGKPRQRYTYKFVEGAGNKPDGYDVIDLETGKSISRYTHDSELNRATSSYNAKTKANELNEQYRKDNGLDAKLSIGDEPVPTDERPLFRTPATIGMTAKQANLYAHRLREMHESDIEWAQGRAEADQRKRLTAEWKQDYKNTRSEVEADMNARPDVAADLFFGRGELYGEKLSQKVKIGWDDLTPEERAGLPKDYVTKAGVEGAPLDDIASLVGFPSGKAMIEHLVAYNQAKLSANMSAKAFRDRMVDLETDRQMAGKYGDLEQNVLDAAKDQVTSETQLNLIGEEILALGIRGGGEASINKAELKEWIADRFGESPMSAQSSDKYLKAAGKGGTAAEIALLKEDFAEAYRAKQQQYYAMMMAQEARRLEKEQKQFGNLAKRLGKRDVKGLDQEYQDVIQSLLWQGGLTPRRTMLEIQRSQAQSGFTSLDTFVDSARGDGWAPEVAENILAGRMKPLDQMTVEEFQEFKDAITSLNWIGRQVEKINVKGMAEDFATYRNQVVSNITSLPRRSRESQERGLAHRMYSIDATLTRMENLMKDLDLGEDMGPLVDATIRPMAEAKHKEYSLQEELSKQIKDLNSSMPKKWNKSLDDVIPNDWFMNPSEGNLFKLTRMDLINIALNWGNKGNLRKTANWGSADPSRAATKGEAAAFQIKMFEYLNRHLEKADWDFVQGTWNIYKTYQPDMETVWRNTSGTQPKLVEPVPVVTRHGTYAGGYYPLIRDQYMSPLPKKGTGEELFGPDYPNFSTPQGHLKERTGATYFVDFQQPLGRIPMRMQQVIHDIAYRDAVMATAKVVRDKAIKGAIINHYGKEYADQLEPWLQKTARGSTIDEANQKGIDSLLRQARLNLVNYALPFNYVVTLTPDMGVFNPMAIKRYFSDWKGNQALADRLSKEIPHAMYNMDRDFKEAMQRAVGEGRLDEAKAGAARLGYGIVSWVSKGFRTISFMEKFNEALETGKSEVESAAIADTYVRERHGAVALHDLPSVMTTGEKGRLLTMFYGYFNTQYNWTRTIPGHLRRGDYQEALKVAWGSIIIGSFFGATVANQAREEDTWLKRGIKSVPLQLLGMVPFAREFATLAIEGIPPRTPIGSVLQSVVGAAGDVKRYIEKKPIDSGVKHIAALAGLIGGIPGTLQAGRTGQFLWDVNRGKQRPRDLMEWARGIMTGEARLKHKGER